MASQALYRKWRSRTFEDIVAQEHVTRTLANALRSGRIAHAYLFTGPRGTGKTSTARLLAKAANCLGPEDGPRPCNQCTICLAVDEGRLIDLIEIDAASNRGIDEIRDLREKVNFRPNEARYKVYVIDEVHMLTNEAFNALLKTLEEPPAHAMFVFATTEPHKVPRTIVSRCQAFEFRRIPQERIEEHLSHVARSEGATISSDAAAILAQRANGALRDALVMLEQAMSYQGKEISSAAVLEMLGLVEQSTLEDFLDAILRRDRSSVLDTVDQLVARGKDLETFLADVLQILRDRLSKGAPSPAQDIAIARRLLAIKADLFRSLDRRIRLEIGLLELLADLAPRGDPPIPPASEAAGRSGSPDDTAGASSAAQRPPRALSSEPTPGEPSPTPPEGDDFQGRWDRMLREIEQDRIAIAAFLIEGRPELGASGLLISFHPEHTFHKESIERRENLQYLAGVVRRHFGDGVHVEVAINEGVARKPLPHELLREKARLVCEAFNGKIVKEDL